MGKCKSRDTARRDFDILKRICDDFLFFRVLLAQPSFPLNAIVVCIDDDICYIGCSKVSFSICYDWLYYYVSLLFYKGYCVPPGSYMD